FAVRARWIKIGLVSFATPVPCTETQQKGAIKKGIEKTNFKGCDLWHCAISIPCPYCKSGFE
ncbi:hypothetical protein ACQ1ZI_16225, partial [Enterococcus faecalis]|uniref:hypothetical protein n=1 Tax=Enterococcus faecalis TaxID=1351 RepID=UPI003D6AFA4C